MTESPPKSPFCPCGSGRALAACCGPLLGGEPAATAEALMRSRYTAYVLADGGYLSDTWHPSTRPRDIDIGGDPHWVALEVSAIAGGGPEDEEGTVEFVARYLNGGRAGALHETSRFLRENGRWLYLDGEIHPFGKASGKVGRNDPCPCGSGRKFKRCCGR